MENQAIARATFDLAQTTQGYRLSPKGDWVISNLGELDAALRKLSQLEGVEMVIDLANISQMDTAGAFLLHRTLKDCKGVKGSSGFASVAARHQILLEEVSHNDEPCEREPAQASSLVMVLDRFGQMVAYAGAQAVAILGLCGIVVATLFRAIFTFRRLRWTSLVHHMENAGLDAIPIISLLTFLVGAVVAFLGAKILRTFGAEVFTVELVGFAVLRELGVLLTAIIVAGRSGSAFTAEIGSMKVNEEVDAMRTLGLDPVEVLVVPRVLAFVIMLPLLTFVADIMGIIGGMLVSYWTLDISPVMFWTRMNEVIPINNFWAGMIKAPFFAFVIAIIGCYEGMSVEGGAESVGQKTTESVVESIFMVIVLDALFAMFYIQVEF